MVLIFIITGGKNNIISFFINCVCRNSKSIARDAVGLTSIFINGCVARILNYPFSNFFLLIGLLFMSLARRFQLKCARDQLLNVMDFHFWFTFGANYKFTS